MEERKKMEEMHDAFIESLPDNFTILEEPIDIEIQKEYFNQGQLADKFNDILEIIELEKKLFNLGSDELKYALNRLAKTDIPEAHRIIMHYRNNATSSHFKAWATLAMQESRMVLESQLLDEHPIFISTGLGGKDQSIRFFIVLLLTDNDTVFSNFQKKLLKSELNFNLNENGGKLERIRFVESFAIGTFLFPLRSKLQPLIHNFISECNLYGNFLREELIITNVKKLTLKEIKAFVCEQDKISKLD